MHLSALLEPQHVCVDSDGGGPGDLDAIFPAWNALDRFGIIVAEPFGALGASLLIQAAVVSFYAAQPDRRHASPQYPEIYLFHLAGPHGDHSSFDFWPPRREVRVGREPAELLAALHDRGITRLALPQAQPGSAAFVEGGPSGWTERSSARERLATIYVYAASGCVAGPADLVLRGTRETSSVGPDVLEPDRVHARFSAMTDEELVAQEIGPSTARDLRSWLGLLQPRIDEVPAAVRDELRRRWTASLLADGGRRESFRSITADEALQLLVSR